MASQNRPLGNLPNLDTARIPALQSFSTTQLLTELHGRFAANEVEPMDIAALRIAHRVSSALEDHTNVHENRFAPRRLHDQFYDLYYTKRAFMPPLAGITVVDVGCGSESPFSLGFVYLLAGAAQSIGIDLGECENLPRALRALPEIAGYAVRDPRSIFGALAVDPLEALARVRDFDFAKLYAGDAAGLSSRLQLRHDSVHELSIADGEADLVISNSIFEHIPDLDGALAEMARISHPGTMHAHVFCGVDHRTFLGEVTSPLEHLTEDTDAPIVHWTNRVLPYQFADMMRRHAFTILEVDPLQTVDVDPEERSRLAEPFRQLDEEVLRVVIACVVARYDG